MGYKKEMKTKNAIYPTLAVPFPAVAPPAFCVIPTPDPPSPVPSCTSGPLFNAPVAKFRAALKPVRSLFSTSSSPASIY
jgi:hypothetical protein